MDYGRYVVQPVDNDEMYGLLFQMHIVREKKIVITTINVYFILLFASFAFAYI
jgi:hypothetical protein